MPIALPPTTYNCPSCNWSKTVVPRSDVLMPCEFFSACPVCHHSLLDRKTTTLGQAMLSSWADALKRLR